MMLFGRQVVHGASVMRIGGAFCGLLLIWLTCRMSATPVFAQTSPTAQAEQLISHTIHYHIERASEVFLVWGINDWATVSEQPQPVGTVIRDGLMYTPMARVEDGVFAARIEVPHGATIKYIFQITRTGAGETIDLWDTNGDSDGDFRAYAVENGTGDVEATQAIAQQIDPQYANERLLWYAGLGALGIALIIAFVIVRRKTRNPFMDF